MEASDSEKSCFGNTAWVLCSDTCSCFKKGFSFAVSSPPGNMSTMVHTDLLDSMLLAVADMRVCDDELRSSGSDLFAQLSAPGGGIGTCDVANGHLSATTTY